MNYIKHLTGFFDKVAQDKTLNPTHISLYIALFQFWNCSRFKNPISISRDEVMRISKISSKATYHKCMRNLDTLGYVKYEPSYNPFKGSQVYLFNFAEDLKPLLKKERKAEVIFEPVIEQVVNKCSTSSETSSEQALVSYTNSINNTNNLNETNGCESTQNFKDEIDKNDLLEDKTSKQKKLREKNKSFIPPVSEEVEAYFLNEAFPELEARKFYNHYTSNGWLVGGKSPMVNWQAAAQNWIIKTKQFESNTANQDRANHLAISTDKNYAEPL